MCTDDGLAKFIAQPMIDMSAYCGYMKVLQGCLRQQTENVLLPFRQRRVLIDGECD